MNPTSIHKDLCLIYGLAPRVKDLVSLWLWCRPAAAAPIHPLAWELPYAAHAALKSTKMLTFTEGCDRTHHKYHRRCGPVFGVTLR